MKLFYAMAFAACVGISLLNPAEQKPKAEPQPLTAHQRYEMANRLRQNQKDWDQCLAISRKNRAVNCSDRHL